MFVSKHWLICPHLCSDNIINLQHSSTNDPSRFKVNLTVCISVHCHPRRSVRRLTAVSVTAVSHNLQFVRIYFFFLEGALNTHG